jgi:hypothetical protein
MWVKAEPLSRRADPRPRTRAGGGERGKAALIVAAELRCSPQKLASDRFARLQRISLAQMNIVPSRQ